MIKIHKILLVYTDIWSSLSIYYKALLDTLKLRKITTCHSWWSDEVGQTYPILSLKQTWAKDWTDLSENVAKSISVRIGIDKMYTIGIGV